MKQQNTLIPRAVSKGGIRTLAAATLLALRNNFV